ncbi:nitrogenase iron-molybdenum cofactor biosynthesis protein NifN [Desulfurobacterium sp.]
MAKVIFSNKPVSVNPLKKSPALGAAICCYGIKGIMVVVHGAQGCSAFAKNILIEHFKEPVPFTNTALGEISVVFGEEDPIEEAVKNLLSSKIPPKAIAFLSSGMSECRGDDIESTIERLKKEIPSLSCFPLFHIPTPDFEGGLSTGYEAALFSIVSNLGSATGKRDEKTVNLLCGPALKPGDIEEIKEFIESFGLRTITIPDLSDSLIGKLYPGLYYPYTTGGITAEDLKKVGDAFITFAVGFGTLRTARLIEKRWNVPFEFFPNLSNYREVDRLFQLLSNITGCFPEKLIERQYQMLDALADTHFYLNRKRFAIAAIPAVAYEIGDFLASVGGEIVAVVSPEYDPCLEKIKTEKVIVGDMEDFEHLCKEKKPHVIFGSSHLHFIEEELGIPLVRIDFPVMDRIGFIQKSRVCYRGIRDFLFEISNEILSHYIEKPYIVEGGCYENSTMQ